MSEQINWQPTKRQMTLVQNFYAYSYFYTVKKHQMYDVSNDDLPKCRSNYANVVLTTCNDRQYWSKQTGKGLWPKGATSDSPAERPASSVICCLLGAIVQNQNVLDNCHSDVCWRQILCWHIVIRHIIIRTIAMHPLLNVHKYFNIVVIQKVFFINQLYLVVFIALSQENCICQPKLFSLFKFCF